jgi:broad specificity phosphatase PhoE
MQTAHPIAKLLDIKISNYDPRKLKEFATKVLEQKNNALIVGHSNTTHTLTKLLGGEAGEPIEETDYERLYELQFEDGHIITRRLKFDNDNLQKIKD